MEYLIPPGCEAPKEAVRDVSGDMASAVKWIKTNVKETIEVNEARKIVQEAYPSLTNDEAYSCVLKVKSEWEPKDAAPAEETAPIEK